MAGLSKMTASSSLLASCGDALTQAQNNRARQTSPEESECVFAVNKGSVADFVTKNF